MTLTPMHTLKKLSCLIILCLELVMIGTHESNTITINNPILAQGLVNRLIPINVSSQVSIIHTAKTAIFQDLKYLVIQPASINLYHSFMHSPIALPTRMSSLLEQLRSHRASQYRDILIIKQKVFLYLQPNKIVVVQETQHFRNPLLKAFSVENHYTLEGIKAIDQIKMYEIKNKNQTEALLTVKHSKYVYKLGTRQSQKYQLNQPVQFGHLQFISDNVFVAAQLGQGIGFYRISSNLVSKIIGYSCEQINELSAKVSKDRKQKQQAIGDQKKQNNKNTCSITDLTVDNALSKLYILDTNTGIIEIDYKFILGNENDKNINNVQLSQSNRIVQIQNCDTLNSASSSHFILICQTNSPNPYIQQIIKAEDPTSKDKQIFVKKEPIYHSCSFNDLIVTEDFFLAFDSYAIDVFWSGRKSDSLITQHSKQHFNIPGLQVFALYRVPNSKQLMLYVVESNVLVKYDLKVFNGGIYAYAHEPVNKQITLQVPGDCKNQNQSVLTLNKQFPKNNQCIYEYKVNIDIQLKLVPISREKVSMSIGVIILMLAVLVILAWICLVKYRGLEGHARKILQKQRERNRYNDNKFTI